MLGNYKAVVSASICLQLIDRRNRDNWEKDGATDLHRRALDEAKRILEDHQVEDLSDEVKAELRAIVEETEGHLGVTKSNPEF
jgi:trimethylamine:corrinoid methyltransferase-like protein